MKKVLILLVMAAMIVPAKAQWSSYNTTTAISSGFTLLNSIVASAERKKAMQILEREKVQYEQTFHDAQAEAQELEDLGDWARALEKYEEVAKLNCSYGYTDQKGITMKINDLYEKAGRHEEGPSVLNNKQAMLDDYSQYRFTIENPITKGKKKNTTTRIVRVSCSDTETRIEMECEATMRNYQLSIKPKAYIKCSGSDKLFLSSVENVAVAPYVTRIPWPYQKLHFALIFPALPASASDFDLIEPSSEWKFKDIRCK